MCGLLVFCQEQVHLSLQNKGHLSSVKMRIEHPAKLRLLKR